MNNFLVVGVTGHRVLAETEKVRTAIHNALRRIAASYSMRKIRIESSLAEGADRLAASIALTDFGAELVAVLPLPAADYVTDFLAESSKNAFKTLLRRASEVFELPPMDTRNEAYEQAGILIVERCDVLLAVWDGAPEQGRGGTAAGVRRARAKRLPIAWVKAGNRIPGTMQPTSLGVDQGSIEFENFPPAEG
jgi:hypothetical protein